MIARAERWLLTPAPATRLAMLRILVGAYAVLFLVARMENLWSSAKLPARQFEPVGALAWLSDPLPVGLAHAIYLAAIPLGVAFTAGAWFRVTGPLFGIVFLWVTTYRLSWGHVVHTEQLVAVDVLILGFAASAMAWSWDLRRGRSPMVPPSARFALPVQLMALVTIVTYVLAGLAKVRNGGMDWLVGDVLRNQVAYDNLRKELLGSWHSPFGGWAVRYAWIFPPMAVATVAVELGAPVAFLGGRWRTVWALSAWLFHIGIGLLMWISFPYHLLGLAYAPLFRVERIPEVLRGRQRVTSAIA